MRREILRCWFKTFVAEGPMAAGNPLINYQGH